MTTNPRTPRTVRFSFVELKRYIYTHCHHDDLYARQPQVLADHVDRPRVPTMQIAKLLGVSRQQVHRWRTSNSINLVHADEAATKLNVHPIWIWGSDTYLHDVKEISDEVLSSSSREGDSQPAASVVNDAGEILCVQFVHVGRERVLTMMLHPDGHLTMTYGTDGYLPGPVHELGTWNLDGVLNLHEPQEIG